MCAGMSRTHYQAAPAPLDEMPTLTDDGDEKGRYDFLMCLFLFISTPYLQFKGMYLLNISVNFEPTYSSIYSNLAPQLTVYRFLLLFFRLITLFFIRFFYSSSSASAPSSSSAYSLTISSRSARWSGSRPLFGRHS